MLAIALIASAGLAGASGQLTYIEDIDGDLSNDVDNPTPLNMSEGVNLLIGSVHGPGQTEFDVFTVNVPEGAALSGITLVDYEADDPDDAAVGFIAFNEGTMFIADADNESIADNLTSFLGYNHLGQVQNIDGGRNQVGTDILPGLAEGIDGFDPPIGFDIPLDAGNYTFYIQQTGPATNFYEMEFIVIPAPGAAAGLAMAGLIVWRRRR